MLASTHQPAPIWREHDLFDIVGVAYVDGGNHFDGLLRMTGTDHRRRFAARLLLGTGERHEEDDAEQVQADGGNDAKTPAPMIAQFHPPFPAARSSTDLFASR